MDTKITSAIWSNRSFDEADPTAKLAALWLITNEHVNLLGYSELSERRFMFETQLPLEALTKGFAALGSHFIYRRLAGFFFATAFFATAFLDGASIAGLGRWLTTFFGPVSITVLSAFKLSVTFLCSSAKREYALSKRERLCEIACSAASSD